MIMIKQIVVCLEGSPSTEAAIGVAVQIARDLRAGLVGLPIVDEPGLGARAAFESRCQQAGVAAQMLKDAGRPLDRIVKAMSTSDLTILGRDASAGTRDALLRRANRPVLIVPAGAAERPASTAVVAYDGSGAAVQALTSFADSGLAQRMDVRVATIGDDGAAAYEVADAGVQTLAKLGVAATPHNIVSLLAPSDALLKFAEDCGAGMMVMGAFARSPISTFFKGSATRQIIKRTKIPVYLRHS
jgi:nucleotide-binding universal stress UspA family protein